MWIIELLHKGPVYDTLNRVKIANSSLQAITPVLFLLLHLMMLIMLVKFDRRFSPFFKEQIANNLQRAFENDDALDDEEILTLGGEGENLDQSQLLQSRRSMQKK